MKLLSFILRLAVAGILLQTLYFKFTGHPDSVYIFSMLHAEPWGRIATGIAELAASVLIFIPRTQVAGMLASLVIIAGAIAAHLLVLGIAVANDGGTLFILALLVLACSATYLVIHKEKLSGLFKKR
ncbi:MAG: hypothetical protein KatS3mg032_2223 [Cyclobacteriaceae bacterium]|nr:MAG: hypothetical protein KatS3mg032_2223 [Cyclobacteriaceae bacterium]